MLAGGFLATIECVIPGYRSHPFRNAVIKVWSAGLHMTADTYFAVSACDVLRTAKFACAGLVSMSRFHERSCGSLLPLSTSSL